MKRIKVAQIGIMHAHASEQLRSLLDQTDLYEFVGLCPDYDVDYAYFSPEEGHATVKRLQERYYDFPILTMDEVFAIPDLDAVVIEVTEADLVKAALTAAEHNLHIFMDKPGGESRADFHRLVELQKKNGKVLELGYMYRQNQAIKKLYDLIDRGELGDILSVELHMDCDHPEKIRRWLGNFKGGMMYFLGCHLIDILYHIQGKPKKILNLNTATGLDGLASKDYGMVVFEYDKGLSFAKTSAAEFGGFMRRQLVVVGTKASCEIKPLEYYGDFAGIKTDMRLVTREADGNKGWSAFGQTESFGPVDRYDGMFRDFAAFCRGDAENPYTLDYEEDLFNLVMDCCDVD